MVAPELQRSHLINTLNYSKPEQADIIQVTLDDPDTFLEAAERIHIATGKQPSTPPERRRTFHTTRRPDGGWPPLHFRSPMGMWEGIPWETLIEWCSREDPAVGVILYDGLEHDRTTNIEKITRLVTNLAGIDDLQVTVEQPAQVQTHGSDPIPLTQPALYMITGIPRGFLFFLLNKYCASTEIGSAFFLPLRLRAPSFVFGLTNFRTADADAVRDIVISAWQNARLAEAVVIIYEQEREEEDEPAQISANKFVQEVKVIPLRATATAPLRSRVYNVYVPALTVHQESWEALVNHLRKLRYYHPRLGTGTTTEAVRCRRCTGQDHTAQQCQYPATPGWIQEVPPQDER